MDFKAINTDLPFVLKDVTYIDRGDAFSASILIQNNIIQEIFSETDPPLETGNIQMVSAKGFIVLPGIVNSHAHCALTFLRDIAHSEKEMIESLFFPIEPNLTEKNVETISLPYIVQALKTGTTCLVDHYYFHTSVGRQIQRLGIRGAVGEVLADIGASFPSDKTLGKVKTTVENWPFSSLIQPILAPHASDTISTSYAKQIADFACQTGLPVQMHLSQTNGELQRTLKRENKRPVEWAKHVGLLTDRMMAVHLVSANSNDIQMIKDSGATACLSPASQIIYEKLAPIADFKSKGLPMTLSTDCAASNDGADMYSEAKLTQLLFKDRCGSELSKRELWDILYERPYSWLGQPQLGRIAKGYKADLVFHKLALSQHPINDPFLNVIFSSGSANIEHVMVDGKWALLNRELAHCDEKTLLEEFNSEMTELAKTLDPELEKLNFDFQLAPRFT